MKLKSQTKLGKTVKRVNTSRPNFQEKKNPLKNIFSTKNGGEKEGEDLLMGRGRKVYKKSSFMDN